MHASASSETRQSLTGVTTARLRLRLLEEADNQDRLAQAAKRGIIHPHPHPVESIAFLMRAD